MLTFLAHILGYDLWFYGSHRLLHTPALWWIHRVHHEAVYPTWSDTHRGHWIETGVQCLGYGLPFALGWWAPWQAAAAAAFLQLRGLARHDPRTAWVDGGHHLVHHRSFTKNYGEPWLDWLCGTYAPVPRQRVSLFGA